MNVLFLTMANIKSIFDHGIYEDLLRNFVKNGHYVYVVSPDEKSDKTEIVESDEHHMILRVSAGSLQKSSLLKKGVATLKLPSRFRKVIDEFFKNIKFDLVLYSTPPITLVKVVQYIKTRDSAKTCLLLKDIFPQNAIDIGILTTTGLKGIIYRYFRKKEKKLYEISDYIGCMSNANQEYILKHNPEISQDKVTVLPNCIEPMDVSLTEEERIAMRDKYGIPQDKIVFVYGGNLGKPQDIPFIINCLKTQEKNDKVYFLIVGDGTEYSVLEQYVVTEKPDNVKLMRRLPREDFDSMIAACDVGLIFLDYRFTIPNYPSRLLSYMQAGLPILACTDPNTDVGSDIVADCFGWHCESSSVTGFEKRIEAICSMDKEKLAGYGKNAVAVLREKYDARINFEMLMRFVEAKE